GVVAGAGTFSAFSATTANSGNSFAAGTVVISDSDSGSTMLSLSNAKPTDTSTGFLTVTSTGSLTSNVHLYASLTGSVGTYLNLTVTRGSGTSGVSCTSFSGDGTNYFGNGAGVIYSGLLSAYPTTYA